MIIMIRMIITTPTAPPMMYIVMVLRPNGDESSDVAAHNYQRSETQCQLCTQRTAKHCIHGSWWLHTILRLVWSVASGCTGLILIHRFMMVTNHVANDWLTGDLYLPAHIFSHTPVNRPMFSAFHRSVYRPIYRLVGPLLKGDIVVRDIKQQRSIFHHYKISNFTVTHCQ